MNNYSEDLDSQVGYDEDYSYATKMALSSQAPSDNAELMPLTVSSPPKTNIDTVSIPKSKPLTDTFNLEPKMVHTLEDTTVIESQDESVEMLDDGGNIFGGGGGGGGSLPAEEGVMMKVDTKKILGLKPIIFYSLLAVAGIGGFWMYKNKFKIKS